MSVPRARRLRWLCMAPAALRRWRLSEGMRVPVDIMREESGNEPVAAFAMSHPAVPALYMVLTLGLTSSPYKKHFFLIRKKDSIS